MGGRASDGIRHVTVVLAQWNKLRPSVRARLPVDRPYERSGDSHSPAPKSGTTPVRRISSISSPGLDFNKSMASRTQMLLDVGGLVRRHEVGYQSGCLGPIVKVEVARPRT